MPSEPGEAEAIGRLPSEPGEAAAADRMGDPISLSFLAFVSASRCTVFSLYTGLVWLQVATCYIVYSVQFVHRSCLAAGSNILYSIIIIIYP